MEGMMAVTVQQLESEPSEYPELPEDFLSADAAAIDPAIVWERLEAWCAHRWAERDVSWVVEGPGEWVPPLTPVTIATVEVWSSADLWEAATLSPSPLGGYWLPASGPYRFTGTAGDAEPPAAVLEAFRRLAEYFAAAAGDDPSRAGSRSHEFSIGELRESVARSPSWVGMAMQNSGAADLLRQYRRAS
jgi:hypothetical protein